MTGKNYCSVENKWCKFLRRGVCGKTNTSLNSIQRCQRIVNIETVRFFDLLNEVTFEDSFSQLTHWFSGQEKNKNGYEDVFNELLQKKPKKHRYLSDLYINVNKVKDDEDGKEYLYVDGINPSTKISYGIEFCAWRDWISMYITQETLDSLSKEEIVAACLYEMTFFGFTECDVKVKLNELEKSVEEYKNKQK